MYARTLVCLATDYFSHPPPPRITQNNALSTELRRPQGIERNKSIRGTKDRRPGRDS
jgi:hypothetical protein